MRVLFQCRSNLYQYQGGDAVQIHATKKALEAAGITVDIATTPDPDLAGVDILHVFNPSRLSMQSTLRAKQRGLPIVISPIYWPMDPYFRAHLNVARRIVQSRIPGWPIHAAEAGARYAAYILFWNAHVERRLRRFLALADVLCPNSAAEADMIRSRLSVDRPCRIVRNAPEPREAGASPPPDLQNITIDVLCVGRLEVRKNQHSLIEALTHTDLSLVLVGNQSVQEGYAKFCRELARRRGNTYFISALTRDALEGVYRSARVHALPSWYETPGLASLEAAAAGCAIVTTRHGGTTEYFGEGASYCDPAQASSIREAVLSAYRSGRQEDLARLVLAKFTWDTAASETLAAYRAALQRASRV